jgi:hypothetical protein
MSNEKPEGRPEGRPTNIPGYHREVIIKGSIHNPVPQTPRDSVSPPPAATPQTPAPPAPDGPQAV